MSPGCGVQQVGCYPETVGTVSAYGRCLIYPREGIVYQKIRLGDPEGSLETLVAPKSLHMEISVLLFGV